MDAGVFSADTLILVNGDERSALGERARWIARAVPGKAAVVHRTGGRGVAIARFVRRLRADRPRVVYLVDAAVATVIAGAWARRHGARVVLDTGDAIGALTRSTGQLGAVGAAGAPWLERLAYATADTIVVRSVGLAQHVRSMSDRPVLVVPDGYDPEAAHAIDGGAERRRWTFAEDETVVGVVGSAHWNARLRWCYGRDVVEAVAAARRHDVRGLVLVRGDGLPHLQALARERGVSDGVVFDDPGSPAETWHRLHLCPGEWARRFSVDVCETVLGGERRCNDHRSVPSRHLWIVRQRRDRASDEFRTLRVAQIEDSCCKHAFRTNQAWIQRDDGDAM